MELFSHRHGYKKNPDSFQIESMTQELRNRLWTCLYNRFFSVGYEYGYAGEVYNPEHRKVCGIIWDHYYKHPLDTLPLDGSNANKYIREFFFKVKWDEVYSFIEFCYIVNQSLRPEPSYSQCINRILEEEFAGYRFVNGIITPIVDKQEVREIEAALTIDGEISEHLQSALKCLSDKKNPNYRNSIKESISAVESICKKIVNNRNVTLDYALTEIEKSGKITFHGAEKSGFSKLYGWTSGADGIRHAMMDSQQLEQEDARMMLIACSAFVNFLKVKADRAGIKIS